MLSLSVLLHYWSTGRQTFGCKMIVSEQVS